MFQTVSCTNELVEKLGKENHDFTMSVRFAVEGRLPSDFVKFEAYSYCTETATYYYGYRRQPALQNDVVACCQGISNAEDFLKGFKLFSSTVGLFETRKKFQIIMDENFSEPILPFFEELRWEYVAYPSLTYYMTRKQEELLMNADPLQIPEGYELGFATIQDAELITKCYQWRKPRELDMTRMKLSVFPSSCIRYNDQLVAFQMVHPSGMLNQLFVLEEHRGKGLGHIVEQDLCRKLIRENWTIFKTVLCNNPSVIKGSNMSPYWTMKQKDDGSPMLKMYMDVWPKEA